MIRHPIQYTCVRGAVIVAFIAAIAVRAVAITDILDIASPAIKLFTDQNGLPSNSVMTIDRDGLGRLWIGTQEGAAYFNGHHWIVVNMPDRNISNYIYDILHASDGSVWFATDGNGIHRLSTGIWTSFGPAHGLASNFARVLLESKDGSVWAGTRDGLFKFDGVGWTKFDLGDDPARGRIRSLLSSARGEEETVWVGTYGGLIAVGNGESKVFNTSNGLPHNTVFALFDSFDLDGSDRIFVGTDGGLVTVAGGLVEEAELPDTLTKGIRGITSSTTFSGRKILWVGTDGSGVLANEDGRWSIYDRKRGLPGDSVFSMADSNIGDGSVWISSLGHGVARLERGNWNTVSEQHGLVKRIVFSIVEFQEGYWFATFGSGVSHRNDGGWKTMAESAGLPSGFVYSLAAISDDQGSRLLAGTENGVVSLSNGRWTPFRWPELQSETWDILSSSRSGSEILRVGTSRGLVEFIDNTTRITNSSNGLPDDRVRAINETLGPDGDLTLWIGTYGGGLAKFAHNEWTTIDVNSGLPSNRVLALLEFPVAGRRKLLVATSGGLAAVDLDEPATPIIVFDQDNTPGMLNNYVLDLAADKRGRFYALTNRGVSRFTLADDGSGNFDVYTFTTEDGLPSNECVSGSAFIDSKERLFVGTVEGLAILDLGMEPSGEGEKARIDREHLGFRYAEAKFPRFRTQLF